MKIFTPSLLLLLLVLYGCGTGAATAPPPASSELAKSVQSRVESLLDDLRKSPKDAVSNLMVAQESFDSYAKSQQGKFIAVADAANELKTLYDKKASTAEIEAGQNKLRDAAAATAE